MTRSYFIQAVFALVQTWLWKFLPMTGPTGTVLWTGYIAGYQYADGGEVEHLLMPGTRLELKREPGNPHDGSAIRIGFQGRKLGYIPRTANQVPAALMDQGYILHAITLEHAPMKPSWEKVYISIGMGKLHL